MDKVLCASGQFYVFNQRISTLLARHLTDLFNETIYPPVSTLAAAVAKTVLDIIVEDSVDFKNVGEDTTGVHAQLMDKIKYWKKKCQSIGLKFIESPSPMTCMILDEIDTESLAQLLFKNKISKFKKKKNKKEKKKNK